MKEFAQSEDKVEPGINTMGTHVTRPDSSETLDGVPARYWSRLEDGRVRCDLCPRECTMREGQRGLCFVRGVQDGGLVLTTYGRSSGFCIDPIEKKPLNHFLPGTPVLSFGTAGCNLTCKFCQNWDISKSRKMDRLQDYAPPDRLANAAVNAGCRSVAFTYNDPVIFLEYAVDVAAECRARNVKSVAVTAGYIAEPARAEFFHAMDAVNLDLKAFSNAFYHSLCSGQLDPVLETAAFIKHETKAWLELTTLLIPGENDSEAEVEALSQWVFERLGPDTPLHFTAFHPDHRMRQTPNTPPQTLVRAYKIARRVGLHYVYTGNIHHPPTASTYCPGCGEAVIGRDWHLLTHWALEAPLSIYRGLAQGAGCKTCGTNIAGVFDGPPGDWGRKRQPIRLETR